MRCFMAEAPRMKPNEAKLPLWFVYFLFYERETSLRSLDQLNVFEYSLLYDRINDERLRVMKVTRLCPVVIVDEPE